MLSTHREICNDEFSIIRGFWSFIHGGSPNKLVDIVVGLHE